LANKTKEIKIQAEFLISFAQKPELRN